MAFKVAVLPGDGIGEEVMEQALRVLHAVAKRAGVEFETEKGFVGGAGYDRYGKHFPDETRALCERSDAILFGSVGGPVSEMHLPKWKGCETNSILAIRKAFEFHANFRPVKVFAGMEELCPLRGDILAKGVDMLFVRELLGDIYFGEHKTETVNGKRRAVDVAEYDEDGIAAVAHVAFRAARKRRNKVTSVDKANVLDTSKLWRQVVREIGERDYPDVQLEDILVDNCAMQIIRDPSAFDVVLTPNLFGDILSDAGAVLPGSLGLLASASFNNSGFAMYEPPGGSAPDIAGKGIANPIAQILSVALMLRYSFEMEESAASIERAVEATLAAGYRTADIFREGAKRVDSRGMTDRILELL